jgi:hypothetical protein
MKKTFQTLVLAVVCATGIFLFQGQDNLNYNGYDFSDDNNPLRDKPTREAYLKYLSMPRDNNGSDVIVTDALGFDNNNIGVDFCEQMGSTNPNNPLWLFYGVNGSPQNAWNSTNGGLIWQLVQPIYLGGACCDPWTAYDNNGNLYYASGVNGQYVYKSTNNGNTWGSGVLSVSGNDRNTLAADQTTGPYGGYLYAAETPGNFARSTNGNVSWTTTFSSSNTVPGTMIAVGPNGSTDGGCVIYVTNTGSTVPCIYNFHRSLNGGLTFSANVSSLSDAGYVGTLNGAGRLNINNARTRPYPMIAMDNSNGPYRGRLYCVYASNEPAGNGNKPDIILKYSTDMGSTWSSRIRVNDNTNEPSDQWFPAVWCEKTTGKLYIKWYDTRENPGAYTTGVWATYTTTGGTTFAVNQRISNASWLYPQPACGANQNCYRGDYDAFMANPKVGYAVWYDPRLGNYNSFGAWFPDFAMRIGSNSNVSVPNGVNDSGFAFVSIPALKLYADTVLFSAVITNPPGTGTLTLSFIDKTNNGVTRNLLVVPPADSVRLRAKTSGGVPNAVYNVVVTAKGPNGTPVHTRNVTVNVGFVGIGIISGEIPNEFYLYQNFPNPFNPSTQIRFDIAKAGIVKLNVYDITGKQVASVVDGTLQPGKYSYDFDGANLSTGVYFYRIETPDYTSIRKMILVK